MISKIGLNIKMYNFEKEYSKYVRRQRIEHSKETLLETKINKFIGVVNKIFQKSF